MAVGQLSFEFIYKEADKEIFSEQVNVCPCHMRIRQLL